MDSAELAAQGNDPNMVWTGTVDQNWNVAGNWNRGIVPNETDDAQLTNGMATVAVQVPSAPAAAVRALTVLNANTSAFTTTLDVTAPFAVQEGQLLIGTNGVLSLHAGGAVRYFGEASVSPLLDVRDGGEIRIGNEGLLLLTNLYSATGLTDRKVYLGNGSYGRLLIGDGGKFMMGPSSVASTNLIFIAGYGVKGVGDLNMTGNSSFVMTRQVKSTAFYAGSGTGASGTVSLADNAICLISNITCFGNTGSAGVLTLAGHSIFRTIPDSGQHKLGNGSKSCGVADVRDSAFWDMSADCDQQFYIGGNSTGGKGVLNMYGEA